MTTAWESFRDSTISPNSKEPGLNVALPNVLSTCTMANPAQTANSMKELFFPCRAKRGQNNISTDPIFKRCHPKLHITILPNRHVILAILPFNLFLLN